MLAYTVDGECGFSGIFTNITSPIGFSPAFFNINKETTHYVRYTSGLISALKRDELLTGGTSNTHALLTDQSVENGTAGSGDSGILLLKLFPGTPSGIGETWTGGTSGGTVVTAQAPIPVLSYDKPRAALITVETAEINFTLDGTNPTLSAGTNYGCKLYSGQSYVVSGWHNIRRFRFINSVAGNGAVVKYQLFF